MTEQGDVLTWLAEARQALHALLYVRLPKEQKVTAHDVVWVALDRLAAALERAERERAAECEMALAQERRAERAEKDRDYFAGKLRSL